MKGFLFDENLPRRVAFTPSLPIVHVTKLSRRPTDNAIWDYAQAHSLAIVTQDADFSDRMLLNAPPPWVVLLRFGNMPRARFHPLLARHWPTIESLVPAHKLVLVYPDRIETVSDGVS